MQQHRAATTVYVQHSITASFASNAARYHRNEALAGRNLTELTIGLKLASVPVSILHEISLARARGRVQIPWMSNVFIPRYTS